MRGNERDSGDGWPGPYDYISPWAARGPGEADQGPGHRDSIAFGKLADEGGEGSQVWRGSPDPWYGSDRGEPGYGSYADPGNGYGGRDPDGGHGGRDPGGGHGPGGGRDPGGGYGPDGGYGGYGPGGGYGPDGGYGPGGGWDPGPPRRHRRRRHRLAYLTAAALAAGIGAGLTVAFDGQGSSPPAGTSATNIPSPHDNAAGSGSASSLDPATVERKVKPGLVDITSMLTYSSETAEGTGMVVSASGLVLTNNHVIDGATEVKVSLAENPRQTYTARVLGYDNTDDVALLKLTGASGLTTVSFGNSAQVQVGTPVLALGDAEGRGGVTPAAGDISGLNRSIQASDEGSGHTENLNHMLQTNAQIQQGDSGGALANNAGQVIGMVTAANTVPGGQPGGTMGFAIPINTALAIAHQIASGQASATVSIGLPGFLGVEVAQSNSANPRQQAADDRHSGGNQRGDSQGGPLGGAACVADGQQPAAPARIAPAGSGALILGVLCGTAAQSRGLAAGDVIVSVNGQAITTPSSLTVITSRYHPGNVVFVGWEDTHGSRHTTRIVLGAGPAR